MALDDWQPERAGGAGIGAGEAVEAIATAADDDPWRQQFRAAATARDAAALRALSGQARRLALPPSSLVLLARSLRDAGERDECLALLRWGRGRHPADFWLHVELGKCFPGGTDGTPAEVEEAIGCFRAALASARRRAPSTSSSASRWRTTIGGTKPSPNTGGPSNSTPGASVFTTASFRHWRTTSSWTNSSPTTRRPSS